MGRNILANGPYDSVALRIPGVREIPTAHFGRAGTLVGPGQVYPRHQPDLAVVVVRRFGKEDGRSESCPPQEDRDVWVKVHSRDDQNNVREDSQGPGNELFASMVEDVRRTGLVQGFPASAPAVG